MIPYFPAPYPDKLLYSLLARYHRHTCSPSPKQTLEDLFGCRTVRATVDLPGHLGALSRRLPPERGLTPERLAAGFTLLPYYSAFQPPAVAAAALAAMTGGRAGGLHLRLGIAATTVAAPDRLRFCPACHTEALGRWGERYWRRTHQLPGVLVCPEHDTPLVDSTVTPGLGHQHAFVAADEDTGREEHRLPSWATDESCRALLHAVARRSAALLTVPSGGAEYAALTARYRAALTGRRLASAGGRTDQRRLHDAFRAALAPALAVLPSGMDLTWLAGIVRKHRHAFHPLHHILFSLFLDRTPAAAPIPRPSPRRTVATAEFEARLRRLAGQGESLRGTAKALGVDPNTVRLHATRLGLDAPWKPRTGRRAVQRDDPGPAVRDRWLSLLRGEPGLTRKALARRLPAERAWLYRHDREWLNAHSPAPAGHPPPPARVDWGATDQDLAHSLRQAAALIREETPPVRVTGAELERRLGRAGWIGKRRAKLPATLAALRDLTETVAAFQARRIAWAREELERTEGAAPAWKIHRLAGLPARLPDAVRRTLTAAARP